jgi:D-arabinitol dehydrogenase (NADP+)
VVADFGSEVTGFTIGDRVVADNSELCGHCFYCRRGKELFCENFIAHGVMVDGGFAEYASYPAHRVFTFKNLSDPDATLLEPASCAAHGMDKIAPSFGSKVLLFGAGPTGLMLAQMLRQNGGCYIVLAAPGGLKMEVARNLDAADEFVELARDQAAASIQMEKLRADYQYGFDIVVEATGSAKVLENAIHFVQKGGKLVIYGVYGDDDQVSLSPNKIFKEEITVLGSFSQTYKFPAAIDYLGLLTINGANVLMLTSHNAQTLERLKWMEL